MLKSIFPFLMRHRLFDLLVSMPAKRIITAALPVVLFLCGSLRADTVNLKNGDKVEGKILSETDAEVTVRVQVTATIKDERVIKRGEIASIEKVQPDEAAWTAVANLAPGNDSLERDDYGRVTDALHNFVTTFPQSKHTAVARQRLDQFIADERRVAAGEVKLDGQWLTKEQVQEERVQVAGHILFNRMKRASAAGQLSDAMATFAQMEKTFPGAASYPDAVEFGRRILPLLKTAVEQRQVQMKRRLDDEKTRLAASKGAEHDQLDALIKMERTTTEAAIANLEKAGVKWLPLQPANEKSLSSLTSLVASETTRLNGLPADKMHESVKATEQAAAALARGNLDAAEKALKDATSAWSANELTKRLQAKLVDARKAASATKAAAPTPTPPPPPTPKPKPASSSNTAAAAAPVPQDEGTPFYKKPIILIVLAAVVSFGVIGGKMLAKKRAAGESEPE